jgi:hypothetical protein
MVQGGGWVRFCIFLFWVGGVLGRFVLLGHSSEFSLAVVVAERDFGDVVEGEGGIFGGRGVISEIAVPHVRPPLLPGRYRFRSHRGSRDSTPAWRAPGRDSNADTGWRFPPGPCPFCASRRFAGPLFRCWRFWGVRRGWRDRGRVWCRFQCAAAWGQFSATFRAAPHSSRRHLKLTAT